MYSNMLVLGALLSITQWLDICIHYEMITMGVFLLLLFLIFLIVIFPIQFFFPTVQRGDPVTHTWAHSIFSHYHAPS